MSLARDARAYAGLASRLLASRLGARHPFKLTVALTDRCDCRCHGCWIWKKPKGAELAPAACASLLSSVPSIRWVNLTGGEIFLRDDVPEIVEALCAAQPRLAVLDFPTTGQRTERILSDVSRIAGMGVPRLLVTVSVEGPPAHHDRTRGREGAFARMVATFAGLRGLPGVESYLGMTLTRENASRVDETLAAVNAQMPGAARPVDWADLHLNVYTRSPHYYDNLESDVQPPPAPTDAIRQACRVREASASPTDRIEAAYLRLLPAYLRTGRSPLPCKSLDASVFVDARGDVYPCTVYGRCLGNVHQQTLAAILGGSEAEAARSVIRADRCPGCWSPCEANPTILAHAPESLLRGQRDVRRRGASVSAARG